MRRVFRCYFWILVSGEILTLGGTLPTVDQEPIVWPLLISSYITLVGIWGFSYRKRIWRPELWRGWLFIEAGLVVFGIGRLFILAPEAYQILNADGIPASFVAIFFIAIGSIALAAWCLGLVGLYLYAYRSAEIWNPAPIPDVADSDTLTM